MTTRIASFVVFLVLVFVGISTAATIELPRTGQTTCYDVSGIEIVCAGTGQDGATQAGVALPVPRFTPDYYGQTAVDNLTGLMWTIDSRTPDDPPSVLCGTPDRQVTWQEALNHITCLNTNNFLGYNDWRLPNRWELRSLVNDLSPVNPALPAGHPFVNVENFAGYFYWSSTHCSPYLDDAWDTGLLANSWGIHMWTGEEWCGTSDPMTFVWPVRSTTILLPRTGQITSYSAGDDGAIQAGIAWPSPRFTVKYCNTIGLCPNEAVDCDGDPLNDIVTDNLTGLTWVRTPDNIHRTWDQALTYANGLNLCGYSNWRLANINELQSMIHNGVPDTAVWLNTPSITSPSFIDVESFYHWSSTTDRISRENALRVDMWDGSISDAPKVESFYAWPVRLPGSLLTVLKAGNGSGIVTSVPSGINCGGDCSQVFTQGTPVTLTAEAALNSTFEGWSGACTGAGTCAITMNTDTEVTATFTTSLLGCSYSLSPSSKTFSIKGKTIPIKVVASGDATCPEPVPVISQGSNWISADLTSWQNNQGVVSVTVSPSNSSVQRIATVGIGNATFTATQKGKKCSKPVFTPSNATWAIAGGTGSFAVSFSVKSPADCIWSAQPDAKTDTDLWVSTDSSGAGNGTVDYAVSPNLSGATRKGNINVTLVQNPKKQYKFKILQLD
jgi:hypothetical protein